MKVRALKSFASPAATAVAGDVFDVPAPLALTWEQAGLVVRVDQEERAVLPPPPETAVARKARRL